MDNCKKSLPNRKNHCRICGIGAVFNIEGESIGLYCAAHKKAGMVNVKDKTCIEYGCRTIPNFNKEGESSSIYCVSHKKAGMVNVKSKTCVEDECRKQPVYNTEGEPIGLYCKNHKKGGMVDVKNKTCGEDGCRTMPNFNIEGQLVGLYCTTHKKAGMVNVKSKTCVEEGCRTRPSFNIECEPNGLYCASHKKTGMVNVKSKTCVEEGCQKIPNFNIDGQLVGLYCTTHKKAGMVDVKHKTCTEGGCRKGPSFNIEGEPNGLYCASHKKTGMVNVISKTCVEEGCQKIPNFNIDGESSAIYCASHKKVGMVNVKDKTCTEDGCRKLARFNFPGMYVEFCTRHKKTGMLTQPRRRCDECDELAIYGTLVQNHCDEHKKPDEYNLVERLCQNINCVAKNPVDILDVFGNCVSFCSAMKQSVIYRKHQKKKEEFIEKLLYREIPTAMYMRDERGDNGCSASRPDFVYHLGTHVVIVEVDEKQHKSYNNCGSTKDEKHRAENRRMYNLSSEFDGLPLTFIRYNPDSYRVDGHSVKIPDPKRHTTLIKWIQKYISDIPKEGIYVKYLFYDGYNEADIMEIRITEADFSRDDFI